MRECGDCVACCVYYRISEIDKKGMQPCSHLNIEKPPKNIAYYTGNSKCGNCKVYDIKPNVCTEFDCLWKLGHGSEEDRPDKSLILFDRSKKIENAIEAKPLKPDQEITSEGREVIRRMSISTGMPVIVLNFYEKLVKYIAGRPME